MKEYYRIVINLYKEALAGNLSATAHLEARTAIACAITEARVTGGNTSELEQLLEDIDNINQ